MSDGGRGDVVTGERLIEEAAQFRRIGAPLAAKTDGKPQRMVDEVALASRLPVDRRLAGNLLAAQHGCRRLLVVLRIGEDGAMGRIERLTQDNIARRRQRRRAAREGRDPAGQIIGAAMPTEEGNDCRAVFGHGDDGWLGPFVAE